MSPFGLYEYLVYIIPGGMFLITLMVMLPPVKEFFGVERIDAGGLGIFLIISFTLGLGLHAVAVQTLEKFMVSQGLAYRAHVLLKNDLDIVAPEVRQAFLAKVKTNFKELATALDACDAKLEKKGCRPAAIAVTRRVQTAISHDKASDRLEIYALHYAGSLTSAAALILVAALLFPVFISQRRQPPRPYSYFTRLPSFVQLLIVVLIPLFIALSIQRMMAFDRFFAQELFNSFAYPKPATAPSPASPPPGP